MPLHNIYSKDILLERLSKETFRRVIISFYRYHDIDNVPGFRDELYNRLEKLGVLGRIYVAAEGINAQLSVPVPNYESFVEAVYSWPWMKDVYFNRSVDLHRQAFLKLKIKCRKKIVADGFENSLNQFKEKAPYISPQEFNRAILDKNSAIIDLRNHYETEVGHFTGAILPKADSFREILETIPKILQNEKAKKVILYCTGGIRCEKAGAYLKEKGFRDVYQLKGGIVSYFREVIENDLVSEFKGKNFVFDDRLGEKISGEVISKCHQCSRPADTHTNCANEECHILFIQCSECAEKYEGCCSSDCHEIFQLPEWIQRLLRKNKKTSFTFY